MIYNHFCNSHTINANLIIEIIFSLYNSLFNKLHYLNQMQSKSTHNSIKNNFNYFFFEKHKNKLHLVEIVFLQINQNVLKIKIIK